MTVHGGKQAARSVCASDEWRVVEASAALVSRYCGAVLEAYDYGFVGVQGREPWRRSFTQALVAVLADCLPESHVMGSARQFRRTVDVLMRRAEAGVLREEQGTHLIAFLSNFVAAAATHYGTPVVADRHDPLFLFHDVPSVVPFGEIAVLTSGLGVAELQRATGLVRTASRDASDKPSADDITILEGLAGGERIVDLAQRLGYSQRTLYRRLSRLWDTLGVDGTVEGVAAAAKRGWLGQPSVPPSN